MRKIRFLLLAVIALVCLACTKQDKPLSELSFPSIPSGSLRSPDDVAKIALHAVGFFSDTLSTKASKVKTIISLIY